MKNIHLNKSINFVDQQNLRLKGQKNGYNVHNLP